METADAENNLELKAMVNTSYDKAGRGIPCVRLGSIATRRAMLVSYLKRRFKPLPARIIDKMSALLGWGI
jgi:hypothetical protein